MKIEPLVRAALDAAVKRDLGRPVRQAGSVETRAGSLYLEGQQVREYGGVFQHLVAAALGARESISMIEDTARDYERT